MQHVFVGKLFEVGRLRRGFSEFLALPLIIAVLFCGAAALLAFWDNQGTAPGVRRIVAAMIPSSGATGSRRTKRSAVAEAQRHAAHRGLSTCGRTAFRRSLRGAGTNHQSSAAAPLRVAPRDQEARP